MNIRILHLSDLHFSAPGTPSHNNVDAFNAALVTGEMVTVLREQVCSESPVHGIVITGDVAFSGKKEEYSAARDFCEKLLGAAGLTKERLFIVPGNHDIDRKQIKPWHINSAYAFKKQDDISGIILDRDFFPALMRKFSNFHGFVNNTTGSGNCNAQSFYYVEPVLFGSHSINFMGLNSALFAGYNGDDSGRLALGIYQTGNGLEKLDPEARFTISFFHHPFSCFNTIDKPAQHMLMDKTEIILTGHLHSPEPCFMHTSAGKAVIIGAGASYETREHSNSFDIIDIDPDTGKGAVCFYKYLPLYHKWKKNRDIDPLVFTLDLKSGGETGLSHRRRFSGASPEISSWII